jgi:N6-adenosine-specific RNA methylase IME4
MEATIQNVTDVSVKKEFKSLIPALSQEEFSQLEKNIVLDGCRDPLVLWNDIIVDGHNRFEICTKHEIPFETVNKDFTDEGHVVEWIINNQFGRRNINNYQRGVLALRLEQELKKRAKERHSEAITQSNKQRSTPSVQNSAPMEKQAAAPSEESKTRSIIAKAAQVSHDTIDKIKIIEAKATPEVKQALASGAPGVSINKEYTRIIAEEKRATNEILKQARVEMPTDKYGVIVIDPPWEMEKIQRDVAPNQADFDYPTMTHDEIALMELPHADDCHLFCWTTHKHLPATFEIINKWGYKYVCLFTWHKAGGFQPYNLPQYNSEFVIYCRRGTPTFTSTKAFNTCFEGKRREHSRKPDEFYEMISRVCEGQKMIDIFSREKREGWDQFGNETKKF